MRHRSNFMYPRNWQEARYFFRNLDLRLRNLHKISFVRQSLIKMELEQELFEFQEAALDKIEELTHLLNAEVKKPKSEQQFPIILECSNKIYFHKKNLKTAGDWQRIKLYRRGV